MFYFGNLLVQPNSDVLTETEVNILKFSNNFVTDGVSVEILAKKADSVLESDFSSRVEFDQYKTRLNDACELQYCSSEELSCILINNQKTEKMLFLFMLTSELEEKLQNENCCLDFSSSICNQFSYLFKIKLELKPSQLNKMIA